MKKELSSSQEKKIFELVLDFEDRYRAGEKITVEQFLQEVRDTAGLDKEVLREYLEAGELLLEVGKKQAAQAPKLTGSEWAKIQATIQKNRPESPPAKIPKKIKIMRTLTEAKELVRAFAREFIAQTLPKQLDEFDKHFESLYSSKSRFRKKVINEEVLSEVAAFVPTTEERTFFWNLISVAYNLVQAWQTEKTNTQLSAKMKQLIKSGYPQEMVNFIGNKLLKEMC